MRVVVDAQLPPALAVWLMAQGHDAVHVFDLDLTRANDATIWQHAQATSAIIVTKDEDFSVRAQLRPGSLDSGGKHQERRPAAPRRGDLAARARGAVAWGDVGRTGVARLQLSLRRPSVVNVLPSSTRSAAACSASSRWLS